METLHNLRLQTFHHNRDVELVEVDGRRRSVWVSSAILQKAFITRAWLDRTLIDCAMGKCLLSAEVEHKGNRLEAANIWMNLEMNSVLENNDRSSFKHFGLELNKPVKNSDAFRDLIDVEQKAIDKLGKRFKITEDAQKRKKQGDLIGFSFDNAFLQKLNDRQTKRMDALAPKGVVDCTFTPDWRLVTGMGEASVYETNLTLHHTYGIPFLPASTIKGILRRAFDIKTEKVIIEHLFGEGDVESSTNKPLRGQAIFFDAFPTKAPRIELDVMTPHYPDYYSSGKPPADWQSPVPITFLTVGRGTPFRVLIGLPNAALRNEVESRLKRVLSEQGLGAKTAVGYGYMREI